MQIIRIICPSSVHIIKFIKGGKVPNSNVPDQPRAQSRFIDRQLEHTAFWYRKTPSHHKSILIPFSNGATELWIT